MKVKIKKFLFLLLTVMTFALCGLLSACGDEPVIPAMVDASTIQYDGYVFTWSDAENAEGYTVSVNGTSETKVPKPSHNFPAIASEVRVDISITSYNGEEVSETVTKTFTRLPKIEATSIVFDENGRMTWQAVPGATEYIVEINGTTTKTPYLEYSDFVQGQRNTIRIKPAAESCFADWSNPMAKDYLAAPSNIKYDGQFISWSGYSTAKEYNVIINGASVAKVTGTTYTYDAANTSFDLQIQSMGDGTNSFHSTASESVRYVFLKDVTGIQAQDGNLVWDAVEEATGYSVKLNGVEHQVDTNFFDQLPANKDNIISIKPLTAEGTTYFANWSAEQTIRVLVAPELKWNDGLNLDGEIANSLFWDKIDGSVGGYNIKVVSPDGTSEIIDVSPETVQYGNAYLEVGTYKVSVQTYAEAGSNSYPSKFSPEVSIIRLPAPNAATQNFITSNPSDVKDGFTINWQAVSGASSYKLAKDGQELSGTVTNTTKQIPYTNIMTEDVTEAQTFNYTIQSVGNTKTFKNERYVTLNSLSANSLVATVNVLAQPDDLDIEGYVASWSTVPSATGYSISCQEKTSTTTTEFDLSNLETGRYENFGVCAKGNGGDLLASNYTPGITLVRLSAPNNIRLDPQSDGDIIEWDDTTGSNADHFEIYLSNGDLLSENAEEKGNMSEWVTTQATGVYMVAARNDWNDPEKKDIYFITSKPSQTVQFTKIEMPTFNAMEVVGNKLVWNVPANVTDIPLQYRVYDAREIAQPNIVNACEYDISTLPAGEYAFRVQAIGDGKNWVTSDVSESIAEFTKLETPEVEIETYGYTWSPIDDIMQYVVMVDGVIVKEIKPDESLVYDPKFLQQNADGYDVRIYAQGDGYDYIDSIAYTHKAVAKPAYEPGFTVEYCNQYDQKIEFNEANAYVRVTVDGESPYTKGYKVTAGGTTGEIPDGETVYKYETGQAVATEIKVYAKGGVFDENGIYYVQSDCTNPQKITVLDKPSGLKMASNKVDWEAVKNASGYEVRIWKGSQLLWEGTVDSVTEKKFSDFDSDLTSSGVSKFEVRAIGNGEDIIGSDWVSKSY